MEETKIKDYMRLALEEANKAYKEDEVPVGAIVVLDGEIIGRGHNHREKKNAIYSHAEIEAILEAEQSLGKWTLENASMFVTLEPCLMCAGAIKQARIKSLYYGASDKEEGAVTSNYFVFDKIGKDSEILIYRDVLKEDAETLLKQYFKSKRR